jgi:prepilin-type N-terminal cleavage/methylation domain-containing protein
MKMAYRKNNKKHQRGFTLIEVIAVLVIIAVLAAIAVSRVISTKEVSAITERDILKSHLRYAQMRALSDDPIPEPLSLPPKVKWGISFSNDTYTLVRDENDTKTTPHNLPGEDSPTHKVASGVAFKDVTDVFFDKWGSPDPSELQFEVTPGGGTITITKNTGFIP